MIGFICAEYRLPYHDVVSSDPSLDEMRKVVCVDEQRPEKPSYWDAEEGNNEVSATCVVRTIIRNNLLSFLRPTSDPIDVFSSDVRVLVRQPKLPSSCLES